MSDKRDLYFTVVFDALVEATPEIVTNVVYKWLFKDHGESVDIELKPQKGSLAHIPINLRPKEKRFKYNKHLYAGDVVINGGELGSHVLVHFFDWETADNLLDACNLAAIWDYAIVHNQQKIFEDLAQTLRREVHVLQDNLKEMKNESIEQDATPEVVLVARQAESGEAKNGDKKNHIPPDTKAREQKIREVIDLAIPESRKAQKVGIGIRQYQRDKVFLGLAKPRKKAT